MDTPLISIVVPIYKIDNRYLVKCIESIISQTYSNIEIILVDDGSPDNCGEICDSYAKKDNRIIALHKENGGLSSARNYGYRNSTGDYLMFVDGDDWIEPDMCQDMVNNIVSSAVDIVMCGMTKDYTEKSEPYHYYLESNKVYSGEEILWLQEQLLHFNGNIATAYCKLISKKILDKNNIQHDERLRQGAEGIEFNLRLFEHIKTAKFINHAYYHYIYNENSISVKHDVKNHNYVIACFEKIDVIIEESKNRERLRPWFYNRLKYVLVATTISGYFSPQNKESYFEKKSSYNKYLENRLIKTALFSKTTEDVSLSRKIVLFSIKHKLYFVLNIMGKLRYYQKRTNKMLITFGGYNGVWQF